GFLGLEARSLARLLLLDAVGFQRLRAQALAVPVQLEGLAGFPGAVRPDDKSPRAGARREGVQAVPALAALAEVLPAGVDGHALALPGLPGTFLGLQQLVKLLQDLVVVIPGHARHLSL